LYRTCSRWRLRSHQVACNRHPHSHQYR
jgi:hypothetical protein